MAKKTPESKEAAAERRQRELAALTSGVAAFSLMGGAPQSAQPAAPAAAPEAAPEAAPVAAPVATSVAAPAQVAEAPALKPSKQPAAKPKAAAPKAAEAKRSQPQSASTPTTGGGQPQRVTTAPASTRPAAAQPEQELEEGEEQEFAGTASELPATGTELDLAQLFVPSAERKGTTLRITADHQQFFTQVGFLLGAGASAPDIVHNILTQFRADHEAQIEKALKKKMRLMMSSKK